MKRVIIALFVLISVTIAYPAEEKKVIKILDQYLDEPETDGSYTYYYDTEHGIHVQETAIGNAETNLKSVSGFYTYTAPDGTPIRLEYYADENGFAPKGDHLPVPPPIPKEIQKSLEYIAAHSKEDKRSS